MQNEETAILEEKLHKLSLANAKTSDTLKKFEIEKEIESTENRLSELKKNGITISEIGLDSIDSDLLMLYFEQCKKFDEDGYFNSILNGGEEKISLFLKNNGFAYISPKGAVALTNEGILFCAQRELIDSSFYHTRVRIEWKLDKNSKNQDTWGSILFLHNNLTNKLKSLSNNFVGDPIQRDKYGSEEKICEYPHVAIVEALTNFLIHRDYKEDDFGRINIFDNRIEFINPGISNISPEILLSSPEDLEPKYKRNQRIIAAMSLARLNQRKGSGIRRIREVLKENGTIIDGNVGLKIWNDEAKCRFHLVIYKREIFKKKNNYIIRSFRHNRLPNSKGNFFGRVDELALLDNALTDTDTFIIQFIAAGGTGKTKLLHYWLDQHTELSVLAWSFYSQGASEDKQASSSPFFEFALEQLNAEQRTFNSDEDKGDYLAKLLKIQPCVLVLDGLEPLQHTTKGMCGELKHKDIRALLRSLASQTPDSKVLCIITSRLAVQDLDGRSHVKTKDLHNLTTADGVLLLQDLGVTGQKDELAKAVEEYGNHALALSLLGNILVYQYDGLVTQREQIAELIEEDGDSSSRHAFKVMQAYAHWFGESAEGRLLNLLGLFDHPIDKTVLRWLREQQITDLTAGMNEREFNRAVQSLIQDHHLLSQQENTPEVIDCHPLLREYFGKQLQTHSPSAWQQAHECLYHYYQTLPKQQQPDTLAELQPLFAAVAHGCAAGLYQPAFDDVYWSRIQRGNEYFLTNKLGAFSDDLAVLAQFFSTPWSQPAASLADSVKAVALNNAGFRLRALGRLREALPAMQAGLTMQIDKADWKNAAIAASNLSELALLLGELTQAIDYGKQAVRYADESEDEFQRMSKRTALADALAQSGEPAQALALFKEAEQLQQQYQPDYPLLYSLWGFSYCQVLLANGELDAVIQRAEQTLAWTIQANADLLSIALDKLTIANAYSQRAVRDHKLNDQQTAADFFQQAIAGLEAAGQQDDLTRGLLDRAAFYRQSQQYDKAQQDLNRAFDIADYSGMRLYLCDYHLETARLALAQHDHASATLHHTKAETLIKATGYHRRLAECQELGRCLTKSSKT